MCVDIFAFGSDLRNWNLDLIGFFYTGTAAAHQFLMRGEECRKRSYRTNLLHLNSPLRAPPRQPRPFRLMIAMGWEKKKLRCRHAFPPFGQVAARCPRLLEPDPPHPLICECFCDAFDEALGGSAWGTGNWATRRESGKMTHEHPDIARVSFPILCLSHPLPRQFMTTIPPPLSHLDPLLSGQDCIEKREKGPEPRHRWVPRCNCRSGVRTYACCYSMACFSFNRFNGRATSASLLICFHFPISSIRRGTHSAGIDERRDGVGGRTA